MDQNPFESPRDAGRGRTPGRRWLVWVGLSCIAIAVVCLAATVLGMMSTFNAIAASGASQSQEAARGISNALIPAIVAMPLAVVGAILLIVAALGRRRG